MGMGTKSANKCRFAFTEFHQQNSKKKPKLTDQDNVFGALVLIPQFTNVKVRIIRRLEHVSRPVLLALGQGAALEVRGRHLGFLQQRWA